jgi:hypothetical protein
MPSQLRQTIDAVFWSKWGQTPVKRPDIMGERKMSKACALRLKSLGGPFAQDVSGMVGRSTGK